MNLSALLTPSSSPASGSAPQPTRPRSTRLRQSSSHENGLRSSSNTRSTRADVGVARKSAQREADDVSEHDRSPAHSSSEASALIAKDASWDHNTDAMSIDGDHAARSQPEIAVATAGANGREGSVHGADDEPGEASSPVGSREGEEDEDEDDEREGGVGAEDSEEEEDDDDEEEDDDDDDDDDSDGSRSIEGSVDGERDAANVTGSSTPSHGAGELSGAEGQLGDETEEGLARRKKSHARESSNGGPSAEGDDTKGATEGAATKGTAAEPHRPAVKKRRRFDRTPSPGTMLPPAPPPRPTMRLSLKATPIDRPVEDDKDYLMDVHEAMLQSLKDGGGPWAVYWLNKQAAGEGPSAAVNGSNNDPRKPNGSANGASTSSLIPPVLPPVPGPPGGEGADDLPPELRAMLNRHQPGTDAAPKKRKKRVELEDRYDVKDDFVDDSELLYDEPTHRGRPRLEGFHVSIGAVELAPEIKATRASRAKAANAAAIDNADSATEATGSTNAHTLAANSAAAAAAAGVYYGIGNNMGASSSKSNMSFFANRMLAQYARDKGLLPPTPPSEGEGDVTIGSPSNNRTMGMSSLLNGSSAARGQASPGTQTDPISLDDDEDDHEGGPSRRNHYKAILKRSNQLGMTKANKNPVAAVDPRLQSAISDLKHQIDAEDWSSKGKFPPSLKPPLMQLAKLALQLGEYNDNFFNWLPNLFPYNRFTMHKLTKREFYPKHIDMLAELQAEHMDRLKMLVEAAIPEHQQAFEDAMAGWRHRGSPDAADTGEAAMSTTAEGGPHNGESEEAGPPEKKWRWSDEMKYEVAICVTIDDAISELTNEKVVIEAGESSTSNITSRKMLYARLAELWPEPGWVTSTGISKEYSLVKRKLDRATGMSADAAK